jgi:hypothetical protein
MFTSPSALPSLKECERGGLRQSNKIWESEGEKGVRRHKKEDIENARERIRAREKNMEIGRVKVEAKP